MRKKTIIAISILIVGIGGAVWLMFGDKINAGGFDISISGSATGKDARFRDANSAASANEGNTTDNAIREYGLEILKLNPQGQGTDKPITLPSDAVLQNIISKQTETPVPVTLFEEKDIKILKTSSQEDKRAYIKSVVAALQKNMIPLKSEFYTTIAAFVAKGDSTDLGDHVDKIGTHINDLLAIPAPREWASLHLGMLNLWERRLTYANVILNSADDQLKSISALNELSTLNTDEEKFYTTFKDYVQNLK